jgi:hypothetical protein
MPNIVGGSQNHPLYMPRRLRKNEVLIDNLLYTIIFNESGIVITYEAVDGNGGYSTEQSAPKKVKDKIKKLKKEKKAKNKKAKSKKKK